MIGPKIVGSAKEAAGDFDESDMRKRTTTRRTLSMADFPLEGIESDGVRFPHPRDQLRNHQRDKEFLRRVITGSAVKVIQPGTFLWHGGDIVTWEHQNGMFFLGVDREEIKDSYGQSELHKFVVVERLVLYDWFYTTLAIAWGVDVDVSGLASWDEFKPIIDDMVRQIDPPGSSGRDVLMDAAHEARPLFSELNLDGSWSGNEVGIASVSHDKLKLLGTRRYNAPGEPDSSDDD